MLSILLLACVANLNDDTSGLDPAEDIGHSSDSDSDIEQVPVVEDTGVSLSCAAEDVDPYDWSRVVDYHLTVDQETIDYLAAMGYTYGETYAQLAITAEGVTITPDGCADTPIEFTDIRLEIGREMGYVAPPGETSWIVEYNSEHGSQELGGYDDARWWAPLYDGPVLKAFLYRYATSYLAMPSRKFAWMTFSASYWPDSITVIDNSIEPPKEDMMDRQYGEGGWVSLWEGGPWWYECQAGECDDTRFSECMTELTELANRDTLIEQTSECFDWSGIAAEYAWEVYFGHWDGCMSPHNCLITEVSTDGDPESGNTQFSLQMTGPDLVASQTYSPVEYVQFETWNEIQAYCWMDQSEGGCRDQFVDDLRLLISVGREGLMLTDLQTVVDKRMELGLWWDGEDDDWANDLGDWLTVRPDYVEAALELALDPCSDWSYWYYGGGEYYWGDTGMVYSSPDGCGGDTGTIDTGMRSDTGGIIDTADTGTTLDDTSGSDTAGDSAGDTGL